MKNLSKQQMSKFSPAVYLCTAVLLLLSASLPAQAAKKVWTRGLKSRNYDFYIYDSKKSLFRKVLNNLENARSQFEIFLPPPPGVTPARGIVNIYRTRQQYLSAVGKEFSWSSGVWNGKTLEISPPPGESSRNAYRKYTSTVIYHEGFHQYLDSILENKVMPGMWFNEGSAQVFEDIQNSGNIAIPRKKENELVKAVRMFHGDLYTFMKKDYKQFYEAKSRNLNYRFANALMFYLYVGAASENSPFAKIPVRYVHLLRRYRDQFKALNVLKKEFDFKQLERELRAFWGSTSRINRARRYRKQP